MAALQHEDERRVGGGGFTREELMGGDSNERVLSAHETNSFDIILKVKAVGAEDQHEAEGAFAQLAFGHLSRFAAALESVR